MKMNKIIIDSILYKEDIILLENKTINNIDVSGQSEINLLNCSLTNTTINIGDNSSLIINCFNIITKLNNNIKINISNKSSILFNHSYICTDEYNLHITSDFKKSESNISVNVNALNDGGKSNIDIDGLIKSQKINNVLNENIKVYNINNGSCIGMPKMYINTSKIIANHNITISNISKEELFYLMSKGINYSNAIKIICNGFLISKIKNDELKTKIKEILIRR